MATEQFSNNAQSSLAVAITSGATSLTVANASAFPASGNFRVLIDAEILLVTAVAGNTFTVSRGQEGTTAAAHNLGTYVTHVLTAGGLSNCPRSMTTTGDLEYLASSGAVVRLGIGSAGQLLNVAGGVPAWHTLSSSDIDAVLPADVVVTDAANTWGVSPQKITHDATGHVGLIIDSTGLSSGMTADHQQWNVKGYGLVSLDSGGGLLNIKYLNIGSTARPSQGSAFLNTPTGGPSPTFTFTIQDVTEAFFGVAAANASLVSEALLGDLCFVAKTGNLLFAPNNQHSALYLSGSSGFVVIADSFTSPNSRLHVRSTANDNTVLATLTLGRHRFSGTPAVGYGGRTVYQLTSSTTPDRGAAEEQWTWVVATDAARAARWAVGVHDASTADGSPREGLRVESDGTQALLGFYGVAAVARAVLATGAGHTVDDVIAALQNLGLVKQS